MIVSVTAARSVRGRCAKARARRCCSASRCRRSSACRRIPTGRRRCAVAVSKTSHRSRSIPWPAGSFGIAHEDGRRISRCIAYLRESPSDNGYARPIEGLIAFFDQGAGEVLEVVDLGVVPMPPERGCVPARRRRRRCATTSSPSRSSSPTEPSFHVDGNHVRWQRWSFRVGFDPYEGLVLHTVGYHDGDRVRPVLHRASVCEMVVPYGDPGADARVEERVRRRRVGPRSDGELAAAGVRLPRRRSSTSTRCSRPSRASRTRWSTPSACTKRTTGSSGSTWTSAAAPTRSVGHGASSSASSPPSGTTSTASTGTSTSTATSSSR